VLYSLITGTCKAESAEQGIEEDYKKWAFAIARFISPIDWLAVRFFLKVELQQNYCWESLVFRQAPNREKNQILSDGEPYRGIL
jgi:hypothetical protein